MAAWGLDPDIHIAPEAGLFLVRFGPRRPEVPARVWRTSSEPGHPGNVMDRGDAWWCWDAELCGQSADPLLVMRARERRPITAEEYEYQVSLIAWLRVHRPRDPRLFPLRMTRIEHMEAPVPE